MPCIFILSAVSYLKTEIILFHVRGSLCFQDKNLLSLSSELDSTAAHLMVLSHVLTSYLCVVYLRIENVHVNIVFILARHTTNSNFSSRKKKIEFVLAAICLSRILAEVMKLCAIKV